MKAPAADILAASSTSRAAAARLAQPALAAPALAPSPGPSDPEVVRLNAKDALGRRGEQIAAEYLQREGFRILDRNWRCAEGEIDIVAADRRVLVACEVKTRSGTGYGTPIEAVTRQKRSRLRRLAVQWVLAHGVLFDEVRVDVVGVLGSPSQGFTVEHVRGVG
jgi:putative endonuclease